jgi:replicative DNA helicase
MTSALFKKINFIIKNPTITSDAAIEEIKLLLASEDKNQGSIQPTELAAELISRKAQELKNPFQRDVCYATGFDGFDKYYNGFYPGELVVIGGRPGMGKTSLMISLALYMSLQTPLVFISMDVSTDILSTRMIAALTGIPHISMRDHNLNDEQLEQIDSTKVGLLKRLLYINDTLFSQLTQLSDYIREMATENKIKIFFIDYLQLLNNVRFKGYNREQEVNDIMRELKSLCKELNISIVISSQLSRNVEMRGGDKRPHLSDLRDSGSIEQASDKVIFVYRAEYYKLYEDCFIDDMHQTMSLILAKNRSGSTGEILLKHNDYLTQFSDMSKNEQEFKIKPTDDAHPWE